LLQLYNNKTSLTVDMFEEIFKEGKFRAVPRKCYKITLQGCKESFIMGSARVANGGTFSEYQGKG